MKNIVTPLSVGILTCIALGFLIWGALRVKKGVAPGAKVLRLHAFFRDASGVGPRTRVVLAGVNVGQIDAIELAGARAKVTMEVREEANLKQDAEVHKRQASVLGQYYLEVIPGTRDPPLRDGDEIRIVRDVVGFSEILGRLGGITGTIDLVARDVQKVTGRLADVFGSDKGAGRMQEILDNTAQIARKINQAILATTRKLNRILENFGKFSGTLNRYTDETVGRVRDVLTQVHEIAKSVRGIVDQSGGNLRHNFDQVRTTLDNVRKAIDTVNRSLGHVENVTKRVDQGQGLIGQLTSEKSGKILEKGERLVDKASGVVDKTSDVIDTIGEATEGLGTFIGPLTRLQPNFDLHTEVSGLSGKVKNYVGLRLQPSIDKYYLIELVDDPRGRTTFRKTITRSTSSRTDPVVSEEATVTEDKLKFSFQLAKQFLTTAWNFAITARFGIKESSGGIGFDFALPANFEVQLDLFDFIGDDRPRFKTWGMWHFAKYFYLAFGGDDLLNSASRDFFVGLGLRFTDEDLKSILLVAPRPP